MLMVSINNLNPLVGLTGESLIIYEHTTTSLIIAHAERFLLSRECACYDINRSSPIDYAIKTMDSSLLAHD